MDNRTNPQEMLIGNVDGSHGRDQSVEPPIRFYLKHGQMTAAGCSTMFMVAMNALSRYMTTCRGLPPHEAQPVVCENCVQGGVVVA
jgi:hypothetical protein